MDQSSRYQEDAQAVALRHALEGVRAEELSPKGRIVLLKHVIREFIGVWRPGLPPGFEPYGRRVAIAEVDYGGCATPATKMMALARIESGEGDQTGNNTLVVTLEGALLLERSSGDTAHFVDRFWVAALDDHDLAGLLTDPTILRTALTSLKAAVRTRSERTLAAVSSIQPHLEAISSR